MKIEVFVTVICSSSLLSFSRHYSILLPPWLFKKLAVAEVDLGENVELLIFMGWG